jgi:NADH-quinone oxidoreductase subunit L
MRRMGGLWGKLPVTGTTFLVGVLAISGLPFLSGFYSKDAILAGAWHRFPVLFWVGLGAAVLTAFYMTRLFVMTFLGRPRDEHVHEHAHEGGLALTGPLVVLAVLSVIAGWGAWHETLLDPPVHTVVAGADTVGDVHHFEHDSTVMVLAIAAGLGGLALGWVVFGVLGAGVARLKRPLRGLEAACANKFFFDELYREVLLRPAYGVARLFAIFDSRGVDGVVNAVGRGGLFTARASGLTDAIVVDGAVRDVGAVCLAGGGAVTRTQSGRIRLYLSLSVGLVALILVLQGIL